MPETIAIIARSVKPELSDFRALNVAMARRIVRGMDVIDGAWIRARLTGRRGEQTALANHMGITADKLNKVLAGKRNVQPHEIPLVLSFFGGGPELSDDEKALLSAYRAASPDRRRLMVEMARLFPEADAAPGLEGA